LSHMARTRNVRLYIQNCGSGTSDFDTALATVEIMNWTGHVLIIPRTNIVSEPDRNEFKRPGVYILVGETNDEQRTKIYVGESENVGNRLRKHQSDKSRDFWTVACVITSRDQNLTKAHIRYIEGRLIAMARDAETASVTNNASPEPATLPEADTADMEYFIEQLRFTLSLLGFDYFGKDRRLVFGQ